MESRSQLDSLLAKCVALRGELEAEGDQDTDAQIDSAQGMRSSGESAQAENKGELLRESNV